MIFNSVEFFFFFIVLFGVLAITKPRRWRLTTLLVASYVFYGLWDWRFLSLLAISTVVDFNVGRRLAATDVQLHRRLLLFISLAVNLGILGVFKYANFFASSLIRLLEPIGLEPSTPLLTVVLPVGISFYTFQTMSYTIDVYRRKLEPTNDLILFATFVAYFPQLVAGPIERATRLLPQLQRLDGHGVDRSMRREGVWMILLGLVRKVVLADLLAPVVSRAFAEPGNLSWITVLAGVVAFAIQIYGDFAGYTDIARGVSRLLGIELMENFSQPYLSRNITEFWRRWHISLSTWLRDYLYISLGGNRRGPRRQYLNQMLTMLLGGLWHGASWNFVIWGGIHGAMLALHRISGGSPRESEPVVLRQAPRIIGTFAIVCVGWVFFRAETLSEASEVLRSILTLNSGQLLRGDLLLVATLGLTAIGLDLVQRSELRVGVSALTAAATTGVVAIVVASGGQSVPFIYFQF